MVEIEFEYEIFFVMFNYNILIYSCIMYNMYIYMLELAIYFERNSNEIEENVMSNGR